MAILFALAAAIGWGSSDYAGGHASRRSSAVSVVILTHLASVIALVVIAVMPGQTGSPELADLLWGLAAGLGGGFGAMLLFSGLGKGSMSVVAPITAVGAAMIPLLAGVLQGESLGLLGLLGIALALGAIVMVSLSGEDETSDDAVDNDASGDADGPPDDAGDPSGDGVLGDGGDERIRPAHASSRATQDAIIEAYEREFSATEPARVPETVPSGSATTPITVGSWSAPQGAAVSLAAPPLLGQASSFNQLAAAVHLERDRFELARLNQMRPVIETPMPDMFNDAPKARRKLPQLRRESGPTSSHTKTAAPQIAGPAIAQPSPRRGIGSIVRTMLSRPGVVEALFSGIGFGLFFVFIARTSESAGHWPLVGARFISVVMFAAGAIIATTAVMPDRKSRPAVILAGLLDAAAAVFFVLSTRNGLLSVGAVLASLYPAVTVLLARFVGKERVTGRQAIGLVLAGLAVSMLAL